MPHQTGIHKLSRVSGQRRAMFRGLVRSLILHQRIRTTEARAKAVRPLVERLMTWGRRSLIALDQGNGPEGQPGPSTAVGWPCLLYTSPSPRD